MTQASILASKMADATTRVAMLVGMSEAEIQAGTKEFISSLPRSAKAIMRVPTYELKSFCYGLYRIGRRNLPLCWMPRSIRFLTW